MPTNWVSVFLLVHLPFMRRAVGLTILSRLWRPDPEASNNKGAKRKPNGDYPTKPELARKMLDLIIARFPDRAIELVGDSAYATKAFAGVGARVSVASRLNGRAHRPVRLCLPDNRDHLVRTAWPRRTRRQPPPPTLPLVPAKALPVLPRHALMPTPRGDRRAIPASYPPPLNPPTNLTSRASAQDRSRITAKLETLRALEISGLISRAGPARSVCDARDRQLADLTDESPWATLAKREFALGCGKTLGHKRHQTSCIVPSSRHPIARQTV